MNSPVSLFAAAAVALSLAIPANAAGGQSGWGRTPPSTVSLSNAEATTLTFTREEEKLARDTYLALHDIWGDVIFIQIAASEQSHMDAILRMLDKYGLPDPAENMPEGEFTDPALQELYNELIAKGTQSRVDALEVGVIIELMDMDDLEAAIKQTNNADLDRVYGNLLDGSVRHLAAFLEALETLTATP